MTTFMRWTGRILAGFLALVVLAYVAHGVWGTWQVHQAKDDARETVRMLQRDTGITDQVVKDNRAVLGQPEQSWSQVVCRLGTNDAGWIVQDYTQRCSRQVVDLYPASKQQLAEGLGEPGDDIRVTQCAGTSCGPVPESGSSGFGARAATPAVWEVQGDLGAGDYTMVVVEGPVGQSVLGCHPWKIVFCNGPVDRPVLPEPVSARR